MNILEKLSSLAVIAMAIAVVFTLWRSDFRTGAPRASAAQSESALKGRTLDAHSIPQSGQKVTVVVGLSSKCTFCSRNLELYQQLVALRSRDLRVVLAMPQQKAEAESYAAEHQLSADAIVSSPLDKFFITATPTILVLDQRSVVTSAWIGVLSETRRKDLLSHLMQQCRSCVPVGG
ncbi:hypothetical protein [uncultured Paludibaculum sp.]|uniref:hypothetical protein n=1 Tax=uncultured Paludibaculum sp. TaxID=1765020 RepID=UPI002AAA6B40|nr:hypothetical protein [uncultured Paludibaculum sp.]